MERDPPRGHLAGRTSTSDPTALVGMALLTVPASARDAVLAAVGARVP